MDRQWMDGKRSLHQLKIKSQGGASGLSFQGRITIIFQ